MRIRGVLSRARRRTGRRRTFGVAAIEHARDSRRNGRGLVVAARIVRRRATPVSRTTGPRPQPCADLRRQASFESRINERYTQFPWLVAGFANGKGVQLRGSNDIGRFRLIKKIVLPNVSKEFYRLGGLVAKNSYLVLFGRCRNHEKVTVQNAPSLNGAESISHGQAAYNSCQQKISHKSGFHRAQNSRSARQNKSRK